MPDNVFERAVQALHPNQLHVQLAHPLAKIPTRAHPTDAGLDLYAAEDIILVGQGQARITTGIKLVIPQGYVGIIKDRSSMATKGISVMGGVIDSDYRGIVQIILRNHRHLVQRLDAGTRIAQLLIVPVGLHTPVAVDQLPATQRGAGGFGSTGQ